MSEPTLDVTQPQSEDELPPHLLRKLRIAIPGFQLDSVIGRGGQAIVIKAIQQSTGQVVAIKLLREGRLADSAARGRLLREVAALAALNHPNIVGIIDRGVTPDGDDYLVMNFISGQSLREFLDQRQAAIAHEGNVRSDDPAALLQLFGKICLAIDFAHQRGIVHRDLCPSNILIDERGEPQILDFGLARTTFDRNPTDPNRRLSVTGAFLGKLAYASPEQARGEPNRTNNASDVYALGVILYEILTGGYPYKVVGDIAAILSNIIHSPPTPPSEAIAARDAQRAKAEQAIRRQQPSVVNPAIEAIVLKALAKDPAERYPSAADLARDIQNYLSGQPTSARLPEPPQNARPKVSWSLNRSWKPTSRRFILAAVLVALPGMGWSVFRFTDGEPLPRESANTGTTSLESEPRPQNAGISKTGPAVTPTHRVIPPAAAQNEHPRPEVIGGTWRIEGDELVSEPLSPNSFIGFGDPTWSSYDFSFKVKKDDEKACLGAIFHWLNPAYRYHFHLGARGNQWNEVVTLENGRINHAHRMAHRGGVNADRWYEMRVEVRSRQVRCLLDGVTLFQIEQTRLSQGKVGIEIGNGSARVRDVLVTGPNGDVLWQGLPDPANFEGRGPRDDEEGKQSTNQ